MGSKARYAKDILKAIGKLEEIWLEPFVGGANMISFVNCSKKIGNDINYHLIEMFKALQDGWEPPEFISEEEYYDLRSKRDGKADALVGFVGIGCSYSGKWFGGYARGSGRNYCRESRDNLLRQKDSILDVEFISNNYLELEVPSNCVVYCDPPYRGVTSYSGKFNSDIFWNWCEGLPCRVYVSEYIAPSNWKCIWEKEVNSSLTNDTGSCRAIERLFTR